LLVVVLGFRRLAERQKSSFSLMNSAIVSFSAVMKVWKCASSPSALACEP